MRAPTVSECYDVDMGKLIVSEGRYTESKVTSYTSEYKKV